MSNAGKAPTDATELLAFVYAAVQMEGSGEIGAEMAVESIRRKMGIGEKALARKRGRRDDFRGEKVAPRPGVNFSHLQI